MIDTVLSIDEKGNVPYLARLIHTPQDEIDGLVFMEEFFNKESSLV